MKPDAAALADLVAAVLAGRGRVPFAKLLALALSEPDLRERARRFGLTPKGYRVDKAPAEALATLFAECTDPRVLDDVCAAFLARLSGQQRATSQPTTADLEPMLRFKSQEVVRAEAKVARAGEALARSREREAELTRRLELEGEQSARLRAEIDRLGRQLACTELQPTPSTQDSRLRELERELETLSAAEEALRRRVAELTTANRGLSEENEELAAKVPKGRRKKPRPPPPPPPAMFRLPHLTPGFYKSLEGKDRRSIERAMQAVLLLCTEGPSYPGLEVKQIEGQPLWSMRASLKLRVYFGHRVDGDLDIVALADREDQNTVLRRLKER